jgi:3-polyprenyl-4-hydroxybenzoate decarboxylase
VPGASARSQVRIALPRKTAGQARAAIAVLFGMLGVKHVTVVDEDLDVRSDEEIAWAMSSRFDPATDVVIEHGFPAFYADPMAGPNNTVSKIGFDLTEAYGRPVTIESHRPKPPKITGEARYQTVRKALEDGPKFFVELMNAVGSTDGREVALALDELREEGVLERLRDGEWCLKGVTNGGTLWGADGGAKPNGAH